MDTLYTIGHSNHTWEYFLKLVTKFRISAIADVRSIPHSGHNPQFSQNLLQASLKQNGVSYVFLGSELGARRIERECYRDNKVDYGLVAQSASFQGGISRLLHGVAKMRVAIMCSEKDPLTCHRAILVARHIRRDVPGIQHILANGALESYEDAEKRLLAECSLISSDLFISDEARIESAYELRAKAIAHHEQVEPSTVSAHE